MKKGKTIIRQLAAASLAAGLLFTMSSFNRDQNGYMEVRTAFDKMNDAVTGGNVFHINYSVKAVLNEKDKDNKNIVNSSEIEMYTTSSNSWILSKEAKIYKDNSNTITVLPDKKLIFFSDGAPAKKDEYIYAKLKQIQDTIFSNSKVVEATDVQGMPWNKKVRVVPNDKISHLLEMKTITYYLNTNDNSLKRVYVEYLPDKQFVTLDYLFTGIDYNCSKINMKQPAINMVYSGKKLKSEFEDFKVIDNRKKSLTAKH
ncbi:MAG: hypothetical protein ACJ77K_06735 [Bacteroidia bacterium]